MCSAATAASASLREIPAREKRVKVWADTGNAARPPAALQHRCRTRSSERTVEALPVRPEGAKLRIECECHTLGASALDIRAMEQRRRRYGRILRDDAGALVA